MDQEDSWYTLTPGIVHQDKPTVFGPKDVSPVAVHSFPGFQDDGMYTRIELSGFWGQYIDRCCFTQCSEKVLEAAHCLFK